jgi:hypothetical protein
MEGSDENRLPDLAGRGADSAQLEQCPGCYEWLPLDQFCEQDVGLSLDDVMPHCRKCRTKGSPKPQFLSLTARHRRAIACVLAAPSLAKGYKEAARVTGYSVQTIRELFAGRRVPEFRRCYQLMLESAGADMARLVEVQVACLSAEEQKYHPKLEDFVAFPDHRTRLRAAQHLTKQLELDPPKQDGINVSVGIKFETNLGSGETYDPPSVLRANPIVDVTPGRD